MIEIEGLGKRYALGDGWRGYRSLRDALMDRLRHPWGRAAGREFWALRGLDLEVGRGEVLGIVGRNGAGKSTLLKLLSRVTRPTEGRARLHGRVGALLEVGTGFHPELSGRENIFLGGAVLGLRRAEIRARFDDIVGFSELQRFLDTPVKHYSTGMALRLGFAIAAHLRPEVLLVDEALAVGDAAFQQRCLEKLGELAREGGRTILLVSHNLAAVRRIAARAALIEEGRLALAGPAGEVVDEYLRRALGPGPAGTADLGARVRPPGLERVVVGLCLRPTHGQPRLVAGGGAIFELELDAPRDLEFAALGLDIDSERGQRLLSLSTRLELGLIRLPAGPRRWACAIPALPLAPGRYFVDATVHRQGYLHDRVEQALAFDLGPSDFYGSGEALAPEQGRVLCRASWSG